MARKATLNLPSLVLAALLVGCNIAGGDAGHTGETLFSNNCSPCHNDAGEGKIEIAAPAIAGLPVWYVERQIHNFRSGARGAHFDDLEGLRMRPMSRTLANEAEISRVAAYIATLPANGGPITLDGDAEKGKALFATCMACHGTTGAGNEALGAPPFQGANDWYMLAQLKKFKGGIRGRNPQDKMGATMAPMAATLADEQAMKDVIAYIKSL